MATALDRSPIIAPLPERNQADAIGKVSAASDARFVVEQHMQRLRARRRIELIWEKLLLHIDGSGDFQWADIYDDTRVEIPRYVSEYRKTENLLRLVVANAVTHHTTMPLRYFSDSSLDRRARQKSMVDMVWINDLADKQDFNDLFSQALHLAMPAGFCFDSETEVLTESGFKFFKDVDIESDLIASLDPATGKLTYAKAVAKQEYPYDGLMLHWESRFIDLMVTPEHRMLTYQRQREVARAGVPAGAWVPPYHNGDPEKRTGELRFVSAFDAAQQGEIWVRKDAVWEGEEPETFVLPAPTRSKYGPRSHNDPAEIDIEDYLRFMGWYLSEGSFSYGRYYQVALTQQDNAVRGELGDLLARVTGGRPRHKNIQVVVDDKRLCEYVKQFGHSWEKFVPPNIKALSPRLIRIFLDALFSGDGSIRDGRWTAYYTSSRQLCDDVQELLLKVGLSFSTRKRDGGVDCGEVNGVRIKSRRDSYELSVNHENLRPRIKGKPGVVAYKGTVWDLSVPPNGTLFVRRRGKVVWSGNCPVHAYWRDDVVRDFYEPISYGPSAGEGDGALEAMGLQEPSRGMIDCWVGNPFSTVFNTGAKRGSVQWCSYDRLLSADAVRDHFGHIKGVSGLQGSTRINSASEFQRIAQSWQLDGLGMHGSPVMTNGGGDGEELLSVICRETAPGIDSRYPNGRLQIVAVPGEVDSRKGSMNAGHAIQLASQELPARDFSWTNFYSDTRGSDIHGKPWVEDLDQIQVDLNIALSKRWETINKMIESPIVAPGGAIGEDMTDLGGYNLLEVEPSLATWRPRVMEWPQGVLQALDKEIAERRQGIYTGGGYQASSRGESPGSRMAYRAILALQQADNTVHGPVNMRFKRSACDFAARCWSQMKTYGDVPWMVNITGDKYAHLVESYIDNSRLSDDPPKFKLVNAFGTSPEMRAQEVLELMQLKGADGIPFMTTEEGRRQYPNQMIFDSEGDPKAVQRRRAMTVAAQIHHLAQKYRDKTGMEEQEPAHPMVQQAAQELFYFLEQRFPRLRDDDLNAHLASLSEITQDETADPIARLAAMQRQGMYFQWQAMMAGGQGAPMGMPAPQGQMQLGSGQSQRPGGPESMDPRAVAAEMQSGGRANGPTLSQSGDEDGRVIAATAR